MKRNPPINAKNLLNHSPGSSQKPVAHPAEANLRRSKTITETVMFVDKPDIEGLSLGVTAIFYSTPTGENTICNA